MFDDEAADATDDILKYSDEASEALENIGEYGDEAADAVGDVPKSDTPEEIIDSASKSACFVVGTMILTDNGLVPIEEIEAGDIVIATDTETGETAEKEVVETYVRETNELIHVWINGEEIVTTLTHPFYVPEKGWTDAIDLRAGDILVLVNGEYVTVEKVQHEILEESVTVYNLQVADFHTYYVSEQSVLVHNTCVDEVLDNNNNDPQVQEFIKSFEERYPDRPYKFGHTVTHSDGRVLEVDFETDNAIIEFKEGSGKGLTRHITIDWIRWRIRRGK